VFRLAGNGKGETMERELYDDNKIMNSECLAKPFYILSLNLDQAIRETIDLVNYGDEVALACLADCEAIIHHGRLTVLAFRMLSMNLDKDVSNKIEKEMTK